jgi:molybdopterin converting factor subunit 1
MMTIRVRYFAAIRDIVGTAELSEHVKPGTTVGEFLDILAARYKGIGQWKPYLRIAVNQTYADPGRVMQPGDEVAIIPPVSGG